MEDGLDARAAEAYIDLQSKITHGPFFLGDSKAPGKIYELVENQPPDQIARYTDKYLLRRRIGNTMKTYGFVGEFFPPELQRGIGYTETCNTSAVSADTKLVDLELEVSRAEKEEQGETEVKGEEDAAEGDAEESEKEEEDEFEDLDDDDYNAEKYFDDGDDFNDQDDGDEAAY